LSRLGFPAAHRDADLVDRVTKAGVLTALVGSLARQ
jgi:hypothetical protein